MPTALALSPHLDDAAFSCGGLLASLAQAGWRVVMATLLTGSVAEPRGFALACQLDKGLPAEVDYMALRRDEDIEAAAALGIAPPVHLPFREAPHRGYGSAPELFSEARADDGIAADLGPAIAELIAVERPDLLLAPQAIGGHVDHVQAVRALRSLDPLPPILWWRDFPYTVRETAPREPLAALFAELSEQTVTLAPDAQDRKRAACAAYASQIGFQFGGVAGLDARLARERGIERFRRSAPRGPAIPGLDAG
ncbi:PIG-L family deacetylase [Methylobacterium sp. NMS14P]|uniref:PIG-L deacetylase family protein n=1 Tax=Methylobacterium sp. NMS14P TaxID=2894310 RepID=UPI00235A17FC|nr:PIG-L deacetylase family protein [Methylobacterium sp. NMS14P]WCS23256.1 PIG-L family deacetylase [Methylobacterium sp. NMS14P]